MANSNFMKKSENLLTVEIYLSLTNLRLINQGKMPKHYKQTFPIQIIPDLPHNDWIYRKY